MNGIIALCHFCEQHSAQIIICTSACSPSHSGTKNNKVWKPNSTDPDALLDQLAIYNPISGVCSSLPKPMLNPPASCRACSLILSGEPGIISHDTSQEVTYVSLNYPNNAEVYDILKKSCVQSLSDMTAESGPSYFCDEHRRIHTFSYFFQLPDLEARGLQSRFSIVLLANDENLIFNLWPFLDLNVGVIVTRLKEAALTVYEKESQLVIEDHNPSRPSSAQRTSIRTFTPPSSSHTISMSMSGDPAKTKMRSQQQRNKGSETRSICDLTKIDQLFFRMHAWFTWILRTANRRWSTFSQQQSRVPIEDANLLVEKMPGDLKLSTVLDSILHNPSDNQLMSCVILAKMHQSLAQSTFLRLVQYLVVGNRIIVCCENPDIGRFVLDALSLLIPVGCARKTVHSCSDSCYMNEANLVLITGETTTPLVPVGDHHVALIRVSNGSQQNKHQSSFKELEFAVKYGQSMDKSARGFFEQQPVIIRSVSGELYEQATEALSSTSSNSTEYVVFGDYPPSDVGLELGHLAQQFDGLLSVSPPLDTSVLYRAIFTIKEEWLSKARLVDSFERCQRPLLKQQDFRKRYLGLLELVMCQQPQNELVLRFFLQKGLSASTKASNHHQHIL